MVDKGGGCIAYYVYDAAGQRVRKVIEQDGKKQKERIYLGGFEVYREYNGNSTITIERETLHIMDDKQRIAIVETRTQGDDPAPRQIIRYQFGNHLGSASLELDTGAQVISYEEYYPYGSTSYQAVRSQTETPKRYRYTGKERDEETGLYYHGARYYAPWLGRWTSTDPAGLLDGINVFSYVHNRPVMATDPGGCQYVDIGTDPALQSAAQSVHAARPSLVQTPSPSIPVGPQVTYSQARSQAGTGQRAFRQSLGLSGSTVQAGHTMDVKQSVSTQLPRQVRDNPNTMMALHSRRDPNLAVQTTTNAGTPGRPIPWQATNTRHTGQEGLIHQGTERAAARTGGVLTREGQVAASQDVLNQTQNTPWDQRNVDQIRSSPRNATGLSSVDADVDPQTGRVVPGPKTRAALARNAARSRSAAPSATRGGTGGLRPPGGLMNVAGNTAANVTRNVVPGVVEAEIGLAAGAMYANAAGYTAVGAALETGAAAVPVVGGSLVAGAVVGNLAEGGARALGASEGVAEGSGALAAGLTGAGVGALIGSPTGIGAPVGAGIGFVAGVGGYYLSRWLR